MKNGKYFKILTIKNGRSNSDAFHNQNYVFIKILFFNRIYFGETIFNI